MRSSCLSQIFNFITENRLKPMKKWSERFIYDGRNEKSWYITQMAKQINHILYLISGGDIVGMLRGIKLLLTIYFAINFKYSKFFLRHSK